MGEGLLSRPEMSDKRVVDSCLHEFVSKPKATEKEKERDRDKERDACFFK